MKAGQRVSCLPGLSVNKQYRSLEFSLSAKSPVHLEGCQWG